MKYFTIKGIKIPRWRQLCQKAIEMSERLPTLRYIGWDFALNNSSATIPPKNIGGKANTLQDPKTLNRRHHV